LLVIDADTGDVIEAAIDRGKALVDIVGVGHAITRMNTLTHGAEVELTTAPPVDPAVVPSLSVRMPSP
jgi:hypothetical protein